MRANRPGPHSLRNRPRRNTTARSHGAATLVALATRDATTSATMTTMSAPLFDPYIAYGTYANATPTAPIAQNSSAGNELAFLIGISVATVRPEGSCPTAPPLRSHVGRGDDGGLPMVRSPRAWEPPGNPGRFRNRRCGPPPPRRADSHEANATSGAAP